MRVFAQFDEELHSRLRASVGARRSSQTCLYYCKWSSVGQSGPGRTKTDEPSVLLLADAWRPEPTHSIPPSLSPLVQKDGNFWLAVAKSDIHCTSRRRCSVLLRSCYGSRQVVKLLDARQQIYSALLQQASIFRGKERRKKASGLLSVWGRFRTLSGSTESYWGIRLAFLFFSFCFSEQELLERAQKKRSLMLCTALKNLTFNTLFFFLVNCIKIT